jgi:uncharacterized membrane protein
MSKLHSARTVIALALGLIALSAGGCAETLQNIYDNAAHDACSGVSPSDQRRCHDSVDDNSRRHDR